MGPFGDERDQPSMSAIAPARELVRPVARSSSAWCIEATYSGVLASTWSGRSSALSGSTGAITATGWPRLVTNVTLPVSATSLITWLARPGRRLIETAPVIYPLSAHGLRTGLYTRRSGTPDLREGALYPRRTPDADRELMWSRAGRSSSGCEKWKTHWLPNSRAPARKSWLFHRIRGQKSKDFRGGCRGWRRVVRCVPWRCRYPLSLPAAHPTDGVRLESSSQEIVILEFTGPLHPPSGIFPCIAAVGLPLDPWSATPGFRFQVSRSTVHRQTRLID